MPISSRCRISGTILRPVIVLAVIFSVLFGLAFGSFLNVCISRLPRHQSIVRPGSRCPACGHAIRACDNIPILSWIFLRGRCRDCSHPIPWRYPLVELATATLFLLSYLTFGLTLEAAGMAVLCFALLGLSIMDAESMLLPDAFTLPGIALGIGYNALQKGWRSAALSLAYAACAAGLILLIRSLYWLVRRKEGMGIGDAKLLAMIAAWLDPWQTLLVLFLGVVAAALFGLLWIAYRRRSSAGALALPFGSFLCAAAIYAIFGGEPILKWYFHFFR